MSIFDIIIVDDILFFDVVGVFIWDLIITFTDKGYA